jgi:hypothetical protein
MWASFYSKQFSHLLKLKIFRYEIILHTKFSEKTVGTPKEMLSTNASRCVLTSTPTASIQPDYFFSK